MDTIRSKVRSWKAHWLSTFIIESNWVVVCCLVVLLFGIEFSYFLPENHWAARFAGITWHAITITVLVSTFLYSLKPFSERQFWKDPYRYWFLFSFIFPIACVYVDFFGIFFSILDGEGIQQMNDARLFFSTDNAAGIFQIAAWRYPARSALVNYYPTLFFGPSIAALRIGTTIQSLAAGLFFLTSMRTYLRWKLTPLATLWAAFAGSVIMLEYFSVIYLRKFDMTNMPLGGILFVIAAFLNFERKQSPWKFLWLMWGLGYLAYGYTPAIAGLVFSILILAYLSLKRWRWSFMVFAAYSFLTFGVACHISRNLIHDKFRLGFPDMTLSDWAWRWLHSFGYLASATESLVPAPLNLLMFGAIYLSIRRWDVRVPFVFCWGTTVAVVASTISGYNFDSPFFHVCKALVILPVYSAAGTLLMSQYLREKVIDPISEKIVALFLGASIVYMGLIGAQSPFLEQQFLPYGDCWNFEEPLVYINNVNFNRNLPKPVQIYIVPPFEMDGTLFRYFCPDIKVIAGSPPKGERIPGTYIFSFINPTQDRGWDPMRPSKTPRPFIKMEME